MSAEGCKACRDGDVFETPFTMAFQPIVDMRTRSVFGYEALVRGPAGEGAPRILETVNTSNRYAFDQACRVKAISLAAGLGLPDQGGLLSINFLPNAVYEPSRLHSPDAWQTAQHARDFRWIGCIFEFTERRAGRAPTHLLPHPRLPTSPWASCTAIDDFGAGYSGLTLLAKFQPDIVKLDMELIRDIDTDRVKRLLVGGMVGVCREIGVEVLAEGIETIGEHEALLDLGVWLQQGFLMAKPGFERLPEVAWPDARRVAAAA